MSKSKKTIKNILEFVAVYILAMFLACLVLGYSPKDKERFFFSSLIITLVIFGAYENGRKYGQKHPLED